MSNFSRSLKTKVEEWNVPIKKVLMPLGMWHVFMDTKILSLTEKKEETFCH